jgi:hypothetical protein
MNNESKELFTPGEWVASPDGFISSEGSAICRTTDTRSGEERKANAALIAASKDMYYALKTIKNVLESWNSEGKYANLIDHANKPLSKALGNK